MKKQILTLALCLAVSASSIAVSAKTVKQSAPKSPACAAAPANMPKFKSPEEAKKFFDAKLAQKQEEFYKELGLTDAQKVKAKAIDEKTKTDLQALHKKFRDEKKQIMDAHKNAFDAILTCDQKAKLDKLQKEHKAKFEAMMKKHKGGFGKCPPPAGPAPEPCED